MNLDSYGMTNFVKIKMSKTKSKIHKKRRINHASFFYVKYEILSDLNPVFHSFIRRHKR